MRGWGSGVPDDNGGGHIAGDAEVVGDPANVVEERRDESARGDAGPLLETDLSDAVDRRFFKVGVDLRRSSRREVELGVRRGAGWTGRDGPLWGDKREGEIGRGVAVAFTRDRRLKESERS